MKFLGVQYEKSDEYGSTDSRRPAKNRKDSFVLVPLVRFNRLGASSVDLVLGDNLAHYKQSSEEVE
jgi:hypothetical protein